MTLKERVLKRLPKKYQHVTFEIRKIDSEEFDGSNYELELMDKWCLSGWDNSQLEYLETMEDVITTIKDAWWNENMED